jgi:hypothetical protein
VLIGATSSASRDFLRRQPRRTGLRPTTRAEAAFSLKISPGWSERGTLSLGCCLEPSKAVGFPAIQSREPFQVTGIFSPCVTVAVCYRLGNHKRIAGEVNGPRHIFVILCCASHAAAVSPPRPLATRLRAGEKQRGVTRSLGKILTSST